tara:strand:+ start:2956 stop:4716 length:1761 start_codon:yes stop_codon:yes gene_type:complete
MKEVKIKIVADTGQAKKGIDGLTGSTEELGNEVNKTSKKTSGLGDSVDKMTGGALTGLKKFAGGLKAIAMGFRTIGGAIAASGIGLIVITIAALTAAFQGSEEGQNKFAKIMGVIGAVTGNLVDLLADFGELVISAFENPKKAISSFAKLIKENIVNRFEGMVELIPQLGKAITLLFKGEFSEAGKVAGDAVAKVTLGIDDMSGKIKAATEATKGFIDQNLKEGAAAAKVADQRAKADKIERGLLVRRAKAEREIAELRLKAKDLNNVSAEEREAALMKVLEIQDGLAVSEVEIAQLRSDAQTAENTFARSTKENLLEEERLKAAVIAVETRRIDQKRAIQRELTAAENEINRAAKEAQKILDDEKKVKDAKDISDAKIKAAELKKIQEQADKDAADLAAQKLAAQKAVAAAELEVRNATLNNISSGIGLLASLGEESKGLQAAALIGESAVNIAKTIVNTQASNVATTAQGASLAFASGGTSVAAATALVLQNNIAAGIGIATNIAATAKGLAALGKGGAPSKGDAGGADAGATAPAFNLVEGTESNAIQDSITGQDNAVKAIVVSGDVTTAQSADRNAVDSSGF